MLSYIIVTIPFIDLLDKGTPKGDYRGTNGVVYGCVSGMLILCLIPLFMRFPKIYHIE